MTDQTSPEQSAAPAACEPPNPHASLVGELPKLRERLDMFADARGDDESVARSILEASTFSAHAIAIEAIELAEAQQEKIDRLLNEIRERNTMHDLIVRRLEMQLAATIQASADTIALAASKGETQERATSPA